MPLRSPSPAKSLHAQRHAANESTCRPPTPKLSVEARRASQLTRRSSLEPVLEGELKSLHNLRDSESHMVTKDHRQPNLAKPRVSGSRRPISRGSGIWQRDTLIRSESMILADVKTNVEIINENLFMAQLSHCLSKIYNRPLSSVMVSLQYGMCLQLGGSQDPTYILTISGLPDQVTDVVNRKHVAVFQEHLHKAISVPGFKGVIQFRPVSEECLSYRGTTLASAMAEAVAVPGPPPPPPTTTTTDAKILVARAGPPAVSLRKPASSPSLSPGKGSGDDGGSADGGSPLPAPEGKSSSESARLLNLPRVKRRASMMQNFFMRVYREAIAP
ncbi:MIF domain containing protein [Moelleriella libera RCEF 2490]|uniref:L-dopachrome isomerase n=1 Tax=Moelleriella libera RCEF 2490 TaxID=1081109 RepID=A0A162IW57_9HYPO|nr:MIF domain containing protein [Moelleriella libera RCEF 2490]